MLLMSKNKAHSAAKPALFLDRDGVINKDYGYVHVKENFDFKPGIFNLVSTAHAVGYRCIVVTNQAGIGRGLYSLEQFRTLSNWMCEQFENKGGIIDAIYFSPFHPTEGQGKYLLDEDTRKPGTGMFLEALKDHNIDLTKSIMVGDKMSDMEASVAANVAYNYLLCSPSEVNASKELDQRVTLAFDLDAITSQLTR